MGREPLFRWHILTRNINKGERLCRYAGNTARSTLPPFSFTLLLAANLLSRCSCVERDLVLRAGEESDVSVEQRGDTQDLGVLPFLHGKGQDRTKVAMLLGGRTCVQLIDTQAVLAHFTRHACDKCISSPPSQGQKQVSSTASDRVTCSDTQECQPRLVLRSHPTIRLKLLRETMDFMQNINAAKVHSWKQFVDECWGLARSLTWRSCCLPSAFESVSSLALVASPTLLTPPRFPRQVGAARRSGISGDSRACSGAVGPAPPLLRAGGARRSSFDRAAEASGSWARRPGALSFPSVRGECGSVWPSLGEQPAAALGKSLSPDTLLLPMPFEYSPASRGRGANIHHDPGTRLPVIETEKCGTDKDDSVSRIQPAIAAKCKTLDWRAVFPAAQHSSLTLCLGCGDKRGKVVHGAAFSIPERARYNPTSCKTGWGRGRLKNPTPETEICIKIGSSSNRHSGPRWCSGQTTRLPTRRTGPDSRNCEWTIAPGFSHLTIVPDDSAGWWIFSGISCFSLPLNSGAAPAAFSHHFTLTGSEDLVVKSNPSLFTHSLVHEELLNSSAAIDTAGD
ncbi:hypothetical protein PR048_032096 [Dryococelus australis]|uniref:Uncharacterized protein n=1 Tax=Dryococelus australis TaxID=614101 RepID=A0ABQ9G246_9NEOP|nr:hypothetical protein PR048_032096 [Dryococelus australis]